MLKDYRDTLRIKCPKCDGEMLVARRTISQARPEYEAITYKCSDCDSTLTRTVDASGRPIR